MCNHGFVTIEMQLEDSSKSSETTQPLHVAGMRAISPESAPLEH